VNLQIQNIPRKVDKALRAKAKAEGKTVDQVALEAIKAGLGLTPAGKKKRDLSDIAGTWVEDPIFDEIRAYHERVDPES
jgi:hypothetical protein